MTRFDLPRGTVPETRRACESRKWAWSVQARWGPESRHWPPPPAFLSCCSTFPTRRIETVAPAEGWTRRSSRARRSSWTPPSPTRIIVGNTEDHLERLRDCDWIVEAIVEQTGTQAGPLRAHRAAGAPRRHRDVEYVRASRSTRLAEGRGEHFRQRFLGTHFFNPGPPPSPARAHPDRGYVSRMLSPAFATSPNGCSARASSSRATCRASSRTGSGSMASSGRFASWKSSASRSTRSMR